MESAKTTNSCRRDQRNWALAIHRRSLNSEILYCVERTLVPYRIDVTEHLAIAGKLREKTAAYTLTDESLNAAKNNGRP